MCVGPETRVNFRFTLCYKFRTLQFMFGVPRGMSPVPDEEVRELYGGTYHVPLQQDSGFYGKVRRIYFYYNSVQ